MLLVDDDVGFTDLVREYLLAEGDFEVIVRSDGKAGTAAIRDEPVDLVVLDVSMPELNGFETLKAMREFSDAPVIMLTARGDDLDRILGLELGADDYVVKPCNLRELAARIRAIRKRCTRISQADRETLVVGDITIDRGSQSVYRQDSVVPLTAAEFLVLESLMTSIGTVVDRHAIAAHALGRRVSAFDRSVDVHVGHIRKKLGPLPDGQQRIKTVRGRGYLYVKSR